jgi:choline dehydrogenase-like flavoprotein
VSDITADVVIIGSGAGGAVVAAELALAGAKVVVLEAGGPAPLAKAGESIVTSFVRVLRQRVGVLSVAHGPVRQPIIHGRCEGGSTALNAGSAFRLPAFLQRRWSAEFGLPDLGDCFARVEDIVHVGLTDESLFGMPGRKMLAGLRALGWRGGAVPRNAPGCNGAALCVLGCPERAKQATHLSYLPMARKYGADIRLRTPVQRVLTRGARAVGVRAAGPDGLELTVHADTVVVAGGALFSPALLLRSGIVAPRLGEHLLLHPHCVIAARFAEPMAMGAGAVPQSIYSDEFLESEGHLMLLSSIPQIAAVGVLAAAWAPEDAFRVGHVAMWGSLVRDEHDAGRVTVDAKGRRHQQYAIGDVERRRLRRAILRNAEVAFAAGAEAVAVAGAGRRLRARDLRAIAAALPDPLPVGWTPGGSVHPIATCGIGRTCEPDGRVRGYEHLYVADAGLLPTSIGVNPQLTIMALATHVAGGIAAGS